MKGAIKLPVKEFLTPLPLNVEVTKKNKKLNTYDGTINKNITLKVKNNIELIINHHSDI
ncbi:TPA: hypothetical protein SGW21_002269 [Staphylococcus aureus]|nr:hypothetical protein [Staphylococcus aureus]HDM8576028.1 hypothetical protein [Staphylococcus aureus]HEH3546695.1 hypothetical protein [Staphylococcus aureus]